MRASVWTAAGPGGHAWPGSNGVKAGDFPAIPSQAGPACARVTQLSSDAVTGAPVTRHQPGIHAFVLVINTILLLACDAY